MLRWLQDHSVPLVAGLIGLLVGFAVGCAVGWWIDDGSIVWGSVGEWAAAIATLLAVFAALDVLGFSRRRRDKDDELRRQGMVAAWADFQEDGPIPKPRLVVQNGGPEVIMEWWTYVCTYPGCRAGGPEHNHTFEAPAITHITHGALPADHTRVIVHRPHLARGVGVKVKYVDPNLKCWQRTGSEVSAAEVPSTPSTPPAAVSRGE